MGSKSVSLSEKFINQQKPELALIFFSSCGDDLARVQHSETVEWWEFEKKGRRKFWELLCPIMLLQLQLNVASQPTAKPIWNMKEAEHPLYAHKFESFNKEHKILEK